MLKQILDENDYIVLKDNIYIHEKEACWNDKRYGRIFKDLKDMCESREKDYRWRANLTKAQVSGEEFKSLNLELAYATDSELTAMLFSKIGGLEFSKIKNISIALEMLNRGIDIYSLIKCLHSAYQ